MASNAEVAALLSEMALLLELEGANPFRIRSYYRAAQSVATLPQSVCALSPKELLEIPGVGKSIAAHLREIARCGSFAELRRSRKRFPAGLQEMTRLPGLGPKRARFLFEEAGIEGTQALREAIESGRLEGLRGFGPKMLENILKGLEFAKKSRRVLHWEARQAAEPICAALRALPGVGRVEPAGSLRRGQETVADIDILCESGAGQPVIAAFTKLPSVARVLAAGGTKASVMLAAGIQCDLRVVPSRSFGAALQYFTGSKAHNVALRERALKRGLTINEYGVYRLSDKKQAKPLAGRHEEGVYEALGLPYIPPELRENRGELEAAAAGRLPRLVEIKDIRGDFHNHSTLTDGRHSLERMAEAARERGWEWVALGDHSRSLTVAKGLSVDELRRSFREIERLRRKVRGIELMRSMEVDILADGSLDYPDSVLREIDVVVGSVHSRFKQSEPEMTRRICAAAANPHVDILGHLSGRLINRRPAYAHDAEAVFKAAASAETAIEINGQPDRQDIDDVRARRAKELGIPLALDTDAHSTYEYEHMAMSVTIARRAWLEPKHVLNCLPLAELRRWLARHD